MNQVFPPGIIREFSDSNPIQAKLVYYRDPFWMPFIVPGKEGFHHDILNRISNVSKFINMEASHCFVGRHVLIKDRRIHPDGHPIKRGIIKRLPSSNNGTYCIYTLDFGIKIPVELRCIHKIGEDLISIPPTLFNARLMGIKPISKFTFLRGNVTNAYFVMKELDSAANIFVYIRRCYTLNDGTIYVQVISTKNGFRVDWAAEMIICRTSLKYYENYGCFRSDQNYCYTFHFLNQYFDKTINKCYRIHDCPFCGNQHRLIYCGSYQKADQNLINLENRI
ncbi:uncharacterized protein LOC128389538 [Panonychus citri]|uniref:uncharacterized protein LOC128389538 n=1 Tax=Panonychus citri TaxID=50023 RepID=UPI002307F068|nr:uncharacterized protein LOC128389538 [Panonychus citri]